MTTPLTIYVADLAAYNAGTLHGAWIDVTDHNCDPELIEDEIQTLLSKSPVLGAEEFAIHDHEGFGESIGEYTPISEVCEVAEFIGEHGEAALASLSLGDGLSEARTRIENGYHVVESLAEYAQEYVEDTGLEIPSFIHVDWEATGRDLAMDMSEVRMGGMLYLFGP